MWIIERWKGVYRGDVAFGSRGGILGGSGIYTLDPAMRIW